jgi:hypothetical protein
MFDRRTFQVHEDRAVPAIARTLPPSLMGRHAAFPFTHDTVVLARQSDLDLGPIVADALQS